MIVFLVSGEGEIEPAVRALRRQARRVKRGAEVRLDARLALKPGKRFVVVAHGRRNGTVRWSVGPDAEAVDWLWIGMPRPPERSRVYLYCCYVGRRMPRFLRRCEVFGHQDQVPIPQGPKDKAVLGFLATVERLMDASAFDAAAVRGALLAYTDKAIVREAKHRTGLLSMAALQMLRSSLAPPD